ncbi:MAG: RHS repeat-associated core domain-containing protein [Comamonas sp.]|uniref:RHS repeat-associated core domain-containing protein n=1 Tax=Comamonas sp. TaxID=34028 RepID=UPI002FC5C05E
MVTFKNTVVTKPTQQILRTTLLFYALVYASLVSAQGISGIGAFVPNTEMGFASVATAGEPRINWINGEYQEANKDLRVKVLGGNLDIARSWSQGRWWLNPAWAPLNFELDPLGTDVKVIERVGVIYERSGQSDLYMAKSKGNAPVYIKKQVDAANQHAGWQWYDRLGNTINYDKDGRIQSYANPSGVKVSFAYDSATSARILDHFGKTIYTVTMAQGLITRVDDLAGRSVSYQWSGTQLTQVIDAMGNPWKYEYDGNGQITSRTDPIGFKTTAQYSQSIKAPVPMLNLGKKGATIDPAGTSGSTQKLSNIWGGGRVGKFDGPSGCSATGATHYLREQRLFEVTYTDCRGNATVYIFDLQGNELNRTLNGKKTASNQWDGAYSQKYTDVRGYNTTTTYDTNYQPLQIIHPDGSVEKYTYEPVFGLQSSYTNPLGVVSTWSYDGKGNVTQWIEAKGLAEQRTTLYTYDQYSQLTSTTKGAGDGRQADAITQSWQYDNAGNVTAQTDGEGHTKKIAYDLRGASTSKTDALNRTTSFQFEAAGNLTKATNPLGNVAQMRYDARGRRTHSISPMGNTQVTRYDEKGQVIEVLAPGEIEGAGRRAVYDSNGWPIQFISPSGLVISAAYDSRGRITSTTDPAGNVTSFEYGADGTKQAGLLIATQYPTYKETYQYDQQGRPTAVTQYLGGGQSRTQSQAYDVLGQRVALTDAGGKTTLIQYDALGRSIQSTDPAGQSTNLGWNAHDQLISVTDANGNTHQFEYNKAGRPTKEIRPMGGSIAYGYDAAGQLLKRTDAGGGTQAYTYDAIGWITAEEHRLGGSTLDQKVFYQYDKDAQLIGYEQKDEAANLISSASYALDKQGRVSQSTISYGKADGRGAINFTTGQGFNVDGLLASHTYPDGSVQTYSYTSGQLQKITLPGSSEISYQNYSWGLPTTIQTPGATKSIALDALQRPASIQIKNSSDQILASRSYQYDKAGNITQIHSDLGITQYGHDNLDRLTRASPDHNLQSLGLPTEMYSYDAVGNRVSSAHQPGSWSYNQDNQMVRYPGKTLFDQNPAIDTQVTYTAQGHTQKESGSQGGKTYSYNAAERLVKYESSQGTQAAYRYDPFGRRISKHVTQGSSPAQITYFVYAEQALMGELDKEGRPARAYGFNPIAGQKGLWSTDPIWQAEINNASLVDGKTSYHYLHTDHLGTPVVAADKTGTGTWKSIAQAFGATEAIENSVQVNLRFPGQYFDSETGSHYNFMRDYRASVGRYIQSDPIGLSGGINLFGYVGGDPLNYTDPFGLQAYMCGPAGLPAWCDKPKEPLTVGVFGCVGLACLSSNIGSSSPSMSLELTLGGGVEICSPSPPPKPQELTCSQNNPSTWQLPGIHVPDRYGGLFIGPSIKRNGQFCMKIGPHMSVPIVPSLDLGSGW